MTTTLKTTLLAAVVAVLASVLTLNFIAPKTGTAPTEQKRESAYERVLRTGVLRCGYAFIEPALKFNPENGKFTGVFYDLTEKIAELYGLKVEWVEEVSWSEMNAGLNTNRYDAICTGKWLYAKQGRNATYSMPIHFTNVHGYVRADDMRFDDDIKKLNHTDYKLSTIDGEVSLDVALQKFPRAQRVELPSLTDYATALINVVNGKADAIFVSSEIAQGYMSKNPGKLRQFTTYPVHTFETVYMLKAEENGLKDLMDSAIRQLHNEGFIDELIAKYEKIPGSVVRVALPYQSKGA